MQGAELHRLFQGEEALGGSSRARVDGRSSSDRGGMMLAEGFDTRPYRSTYKIPINNRGDLIHANHGRRFSTREALVILLYVGPRLVRAPVGYATCRYLARPAQAGIKEDGAFGAYARSDGARASGSGAHGQRRTLQKGAGHIEPGDRAAHRQLLLRDLLRRQRREVPH